MSVTPASVEARLLALSREVDDAQKFLDEAEAEYFDAKGELEIALSVERLSISKAERMTVQDKNDLAVTACAAMIRRVNAAEAKVRAARGNAARLRMQVDIARSVGTSVRSALEL